MLRPIAPDDLPAILQLVVAAGLFPPEGTEELAGVLNSSVGGDLGPDHVWVIDDEGGPVGVAYFAPERMTAGTWNLYLIAVHPDRQRQGRGHELVRHVEQSLKTRGARLLLVETSSLASFEPARQFYAGCGFEEGARLREFYDAGEDKIIYRKAIDSSTTP